MTHLIRLLGLCLAFTLTLTAVPTLAQEPSAEDVEEGRALAVEGVKAYRSQEYAKALESFQAAQKIYPTGQVWRMTGYTLVAMERWVEAIEALEKALNVNFKPLMPRDAEHAEDTLIEAKKNVATVTVNSSVANAKVSIDDGEPQALPLKTLLLKGSHRFVVRAEGHDAAERSVELSGGSSKSITLNPTPAAEEKPDPPPSIPVSEPEAERPSEPEIEEAPEEPSGSSTGAWFPHQRMIGLATGGAGIALGAASIALGVSGVALNGAVQDNIDIHNRNYDPNCSNNSQLCLHDIALINRDGERAQSMQQLGLGLGIGAAVLVAAGTTFFLLAPAEPEMMSDDRSSAGSSSFTCSPTADLNEHRSTPGIACFGRF